MASVEVYDALREFLARVFGDPAVAAQVASDPQGALAAYGITDFEGLDFRAAVGETYGGYELPYGNKEALGQYASGGQEVAYPQVKLPPSYQGGYQAPVDAVAHVQYATYAAYEHDPQITREIVNTQQLLFFDNSSVDNSVSIDNSTVVDNSTTVQVEVGGDLDGEVEVEVDNTTAVGEGAVANTGDGNLIATGGGEVVNVAGNQGPVLVDSQVDGDGNVLGDNQGIVVGDDVGPGGVLADGGIDGQVNTGQVQGVQGDGQAQIQTGDGIQAAGGIDESVLGDNNNAAVVDVNTSGGNANAQADAGGGAGGGQASAGPVNTGPGGDVNGININFGDGSPTNVNTNDTNLANNAIAGDDATNSTEINENPFQLPGELTPIGDGTPPAQPEPPQAGLPEVAEPPQAEPPAQPAPESPALPDRKQELLDKLREGGDPIGQREVQDIRDKLAADGDLLGEVAKRRQESFENSGLETADAAQEAVVLPEPEESVPEPQAEFLPPEEEFQPQPDPAGGEEVLPV